MFPDQSTYGNVELDGNMWPSVSHFQKKAFNSCQYYYIKFC